MAADFVQTLVEAGVPFLFLTNNSAPTPEDLVVRLEHLGIEGLSSRCFYTSALNTADYVYQPTRVLQSVADLVEEIRTGRASDRMNSPALSPANSHDRSTGQRHQTDNLKFQKPRPRPAMTK